MIAIKDAVQVASSHLKEFFPGAEHITLEEVDVSSDDQYWLITLGFVDRHDSASSPLLHALTPPGGLRKYKVFKISRDSGEVRSMKMRERENV